MANKLSFSALYFAEDKDIYDLLMKRSGGFSVKLLTKLARERGLFVSSAEPREELAELLSRLPWDWTQLQRALTLADRGDRHERTATLELMTTRPKLSTSVLSALDAVKGATGASEAFSYTCQGDKYTVTFQASELDHTRTRLEQRKLRTVLIEIQATEGVGLKIRHDANEKAEAVVEAISRELSKEAKTQTRRIEVSGLTDPQARTAFFLEMMTRSAAAHADKDVTDIDVTRFPDSQTDRNNEPLDDGDTFDDDGDTFDEEDPSADEDSDQTREEHRTQSSRMLAVVESVFLKGKRLLEAESYTRLLSEGFFVRRAQWKCLSRSVKNVEVEFEAEFAKGQEGTGFRFDVKGVYRATRKSDGFKRTREHASPGERQALLADLEAAAQAALEVVSSGSSEFQENLAEIIGGTSPGEKQ